MISGLACPLKLRCVSVETLRTNYEDVESRNDSECSSRVALGHPLSSTSHPKGTNPVTIREIQIQRFSIVTSLPFDEVIARVDQSIGHPDMTAFRKNMNAAKNESELEKVVHESVGTSDLMEFARYDLGAVVHRETGAVTPRILRLVAGNPLIMRQMVRLVPDAGLYAPVTILIDERPDGVHLSYDRMAAFLAPYNSLEALQIARDLDHKIEALLTKAAL
jgi:uncharacterized protein (DUF302 family)